MKVGVWYAINAKWIVVPVFFIETISKDIYMQRDSIFNTSCDL
jgi:hypothetical protein